MREDIIKFLEEDIKKRCENENNFFGMGGYNHIKAVVKNSIILANKYSADIEVVTIAAWLHDVASITDYALYEEHHVHGSKIAKEILESWNYDLDKIELVQRCILNHRGSKIKDKSSLEEICVADGDAISHFDNLPSLFHLAYVIREYNIEDGIEFIINKLNRSYSKLSPFSKQVFKEKYDKVLEVLQ